MIRLALAALGALVITGLLLVVAAELSRERPVVQDLTDPIPVAIVTVAPPEPPPEREPEPEPEPPDDPPPLDPTPPLPMPTVSNPMLDSPAVVLDPDLFGLDTGPVGDLGFEAGDLDQRPRITARVQPVYPFKARQRRIEGTVRVRFLVRRDGTVGQVTIEAAEPEGVFEDAVRDAVSRWQFEPGRLAGEAVAAWVVMPITFDLSGGRR